MHFLTDKFILVYLSFDSKSQRVYLCAGLTAASWIMEPFREIGLIFLYNFHREHSLQKLVMKKLSPKINVKNIKSIVYGYYTLLK